MKTNNTKKWLWGLFFIGAAALLVINQLGFFADIGLFSLLFTILLIPIIITSIAHLNFFGIFFPAALILIIYEKQLHIEALTPWTVIIAAILLSIGFSVLIKPKHWNTHWIDHHHYHPEEIIEHADDDNINCSVSLTSRVQYVHSTNLQKTVLTCSCGSLKVYFDHAELSPQGAQVYVDCSLGSIELYLPRDWNINYDISTSLATIDEKNHPAPGDGPILALTGKVSLGNISITYI